MKHFFSILTLLILMYGSSVASSEVLKVFESNTFEGETMVLTNESDDEIGIEKKVERPKPTIIVLPEEDKALLYLNNIGATKYTKREDFRGYDSITREQSAKMIYQRGESLSRISPQADTKCSFIDQGDIDSSLVGSVIEACQSGIFRGFNSQFMPQRNISRGHFFLAVMRILHGNIDESQVYEKAKELGLTTTKNEEKFGYNQDITRKDAGLILYRAAQKEDDLEEFHKTELSSVSLGKSWNHLDPSRPKRVIDELSSLVDMLSDSDDSFSSESGKTTTTSTSAISLPAYLPVTSGGGVSQSPLKGGEVNDNELFEEFLMYYSEAQEKHGGKYTHINVGKRYHIVGGKELAGETVDITDNNNKKYTITLDNSGEFYFYPGSYKKENSNENDTSVDQYSVTNERSDSDESFSSSSFTREITKIGGREQQSKTLQLAFVIDTTGSMSDQINKIKETLQSVVSKIKEKTGEINIEYGLVGYKDKYDQYLTKAYQFTNNIESFQEYLNTLSASGGGDYPEDVNSGLEEAMEYLTWNTEDPDTYGISFLVADAPPHMDYGQTYDYRVAMLRAVEQGIKIFPLASSGLDNTVGELIFRQIALITNASYVFITKGANGGTEYHVDEKNYSVETLDDLLVEIIVNEIK